MYITFTSFYSCLSTSPQTPNSRFYTCSLGQNLFHSPTSSVSVVITWILQLSTQMPLRWLLPSWIMALRKLLPATLIHLPTPSSSPSVASCTATRPVTSLRNSISSPVWACGSLPDSVMNSAASGGCFFAVCIRTDHFCCKSPVHHISSAFPLLMCICYPTGTVL